MRYRISNGATRDFAFQTVAGLRIVARGKTEEIETAEPMPEARLADLGRKKVAVVEARQFTDPGPEGASREPQSAPQAGAPDAGAEDSPEALFARAQALGLSPSPRWKPDTLRRKIAEAEAG